MKVCSLVPPLAWADEQEVVLGEGNFGKVVRRGGRVFKRSKREDLTYEHNLMYHLRGHVNILRVFGLSSDRRELEVEYGGTDLYILVHGDAPLHVRDVYTQIVDGVRHMHASRVAHRDLKLENIVVDAKGLVRIIDFGLAIYLQPDAPATLKGPGVGSLSYMAPEILVKNATYNPFLADGWSLGIVLFALATKCFPFEMSLHRCPQFQKYRNMLWVHPPSKALRTMWADSARLQAVTDPFVWTELDRLLQPNPKLRDLL